jgi:RNA polymerase sigma-70 factor (ECF subfamily)
MKRVQQNDDHAAFESLLPLLSGAIDSALRRAVRPSERDDARSEVFLRVWKFRGRYDGRTPPQAWAFAIARNFARDLLRRARRAPQMASIHRPDGSTAPLADTRHRTPANAAQITDEARHVRALVDQAAASAPAYVRDAFEMRLHGVTLDHIADIVGMSIGGVASALHRLRLRVRRVLHDSPASLPSRSPIMLNNDSTSSTALGELSERQGSLEKRCADLETTVRRLNGATLADDLAVIRAGLKRIAAGLVGTAGAAELTVRTVEFEEALRPLRAKWPELYKLLRRFAAEEKKRKAWDARTARHLMETRTILDARSAMRPPS